jgi:hypothetical protein
VVILIEVFQSSIDIPLWIDVKKHMPQRPYPNSDITGESNCEAMVIDLINFPCHFKRKWYLSLPVPNCSALLHHTTAASYQVMAKFQLGKENVIWCATVI